MLLDCASSHRCARSANASAGGLLLTLDEPLAVGLELDVYFELPNRFAIETRAIVVRCSGSQVALAFTAMDAEMQLGLRSFCRLAAIRHRPGARHAFAAVRTRAPV